MSALLWILDGARWLGELALAFIKWLFADWRRLVIFALVAFCLLQRSWHADTAHERDNWRQAAKGWQTALQRTEINYRNAADRAAIKQQAKIAAVKAQQAQINERVVHDLEKSRDAADARYSRLLATKAATDPRRTGTAEMSAFAEATCRAVAATDCDAIPALLKAAQDNTDKLITRQDAVIANGKIETSPDP